MVKLHLNCPNQDLALHFRISAAVVSRSFTTWLMLLYRKLTESAKLPNWPSRHRSRGNDHETMPLVFWELYPTTICINDCTEFPIQIPSDPDTASDMVILQISGHFQGFSRYHSKWCHLFSLWFVCWVGVRPRDDCVVWNHQDDESWWLSDGW